MTASFTRRIWDRTRLTPLKIWSATTLIRHGTKPMMRNRHMKLVRMMLPLALMATGAFAQDVRYNFAPGQDFSKYKTFYWAPVKGEQQLNQIADQQVKAAVEAELMKKGLTKGPGETGDLALAY